MSTPTARHDYSKTIDIHEATEWEIYNNGRYIRQLVEPRLSDGITAIVEPNLVSLRRALTEGHLPEERFVEYSAYFDGEIAARCEINYQPQADDINAYGPAAVHLYANEQIAVLAGDLVTPTYRKHGLQAAMIDYRLALLTSLDYTYAMSGILVGNDGSKKNYLRAGFAPIGEKDIDWGESVSGSVSGEDIKRVVLYGLRLG